MILRIKKHLLYQNNIERCDIIAKGKVEITGINTNNIEVLSEDEKIKLFKKLKKGDLKARDKLVEGNLKLVLSILKKYQNRCENMDDLFQVGCVGLMKAIDNFDLSYNVKFSTYAVPLILGEVRRYLRDNSNLRVSRSIKDLAYKVLKEKEMYFMTNGYEISNAELAEKLGVDELDIVIAIEATKDPASLSEAIYNNGGETKSGNRLPRMSAQFPLTLYKMCLNYQCLLCCLLNSLKHHF